MNVTPRFLLEGSVYALKQCGYLLWAQTSVLQTVQEELGSLIKEYAKGPVSEKFQEASTQLDDIAKKQAARIPANRHRERMKALYVEPNEAGTGWNLPWAVPRNCSEIYSTRN
jgi:hypothetical protein